MRPNDFTCVCSLICVAWSQFSSCSMSSSLTYRRKRPYTTFKSMCFALLSRCAAMHLPTALKRRMFMMFCVPSRICMSRLSSTMLGAIESCSMSLLLKLPLEVSRLSSQIFEMTNRADECSKNLLRKIQKALDPLFLATRQTLSK